MEDKARIVRRMVSVLNDIIGYLIAMLGAPNPPHMMTRQQRRVFMRQLELSSEGMRMVEHLARQLLDDPLISESSDED